MDSKLLLVKSITLLYRESQLPDRAVSSVDLIRTVLESIKTNTIGIGLNTDREIIQSLKQTVLEMCNQPHDQGYDKLILLQNIRVNSGLDDRLYESIRQGIEDELSEGALKRSIISLRKSIENHFREDKISEILNTASQAFKFNRDKIKDVSEFISQLMVQLEPLQLTSTSKDPAVMDDIDIGDVSSLNTMFDKIKQIDNGSKLYRTGWQWLNRMTQGGFRPGETVVVGALQHKYKTGFTLSIFAQIALFNQPKTEDKAKKPLLLRISFEDELVNNLKFVYQYLKYNETYQYVDIADTTIGEMSEYVKKNLSVNGFHVKMMRVDPSQWTYRSICNKIIELEAQGYSVEVLMLDYLSKVNRAGCNAGVIGSEMGDLLNRMRNFCSSRGTLLLTPHQLSTEAKNLIRGTLPEEVFVKEIAEKGYWEENKGLDRIFDLGLLIHLFKYNKETYFAIARDKHRIPTIIDDDDKFAMMKFPHKMPIPHDINGDDISFKKIGKAVSNANDDLFKMG